MINGVNFNPNIAQSCPKTDAPVTQPSIKGNHEMSPETSSAYRAYGQAMINKPLEQLSLNDCILQLQKQGKVEGKDYRLENYESGNTAIYLLNKNGQKTKRMLFKEDKIDCWEDFKYADNRKVKTIYHDTNGKIPMYEDCYYNNEIPQEAFTKDKLTYDTTPELYIEYLNKNKINYKIERTGEENNNRSLYITEFDKNNKITQSTWYYYGDNTFNQKHQMLSRSIYDNNEAEIKRIELEKDRTSVCTHLEKWGKGKSYSREDVLQETFTKEHITAETTADEYIEYLRKNNKNFEVSNKNNGTSIKEYDDNGKEIQSTYFETNKEKFIMREEYLPNGNRKRIEFNKNDTYITNFYYD